MRRESAGGEGEEGIVMERGRDAALAWSELSLHWMERTVNGTRTEPKFTGKTADITFYHSIIQYVQYV